MKKPTEGKVALISFLEEVEKEKLAKKGPSNAEKLAGACKFKEVSEEGDSSEKCSKCGNPLTKLKGFNLRDNKDVEIKTCLNCARKGEAWKGSFASKPNPWDKTKTEETDEPREMDESAFSRQHYQAIADILKAEVGLEPAGDDVVRTITNKLVELFKKDNPNFDTNKFIQAVGIDMNPNKDIQGKK